MSMKNILVHLELSDSLPSVLTSALLAARRFDSHIEGMHVRHAVPDVVAVGADGFVAATPELVDSFERREQEHSRRARGAFDAFVEANGLASGGAPHPSVEVTADWNEVVSPDDEVIGSRGRLFDLLVVGRPIKGHSAPSMNTLETALFESGRPVLVAPPAAPTSLGETVVIAWNCSSETARTVALAMPFLARAKRVVVLTVQGGTVPGPTGLDLAQSLVRNGVEAEAIERASERRLVGETILKEAAGIGADLLIKGAYTQSRLRQMIFGGATSHILQAAELPVLLAH
jgi:nucleotide-binding universal stress UspA family protein